MVSVVDDLGIEPTPKVERLKFGFQKLVRTRIVARMQAEGTNARWWVLNRSELVPELVRKLQEESSEVDEQDPEKCLGELADLQEVVDTLLRIEPAVREATAVYQAMIGTRLLAVGYTEEDMRMVQHEKFQKLGGFAEGVYVDTVEISSDNPWVEHLRANPDRYPEELIS